MECYAVKQLDNNNITFFAKSHEKRFGIFTHQELIKSPDIFTPSLRDFYVIFWIRKGSGKIVIDFNEYRFKSNTIILLNKDQISHFMNFDKKKTELLSVVFSPDFVFESSESLNNLFTFNAILHNKGIANIISVQQKQAQRFENLLDYLIQVNPVEPTKDDTPKKKESKESPKSKESSLNEKLFFSYPFHYFA